MVDSAQGEMGRLIVAAPRGFCAGVDRAIDIVDLALEAFPPPLYVRKEIVHNKAVVDGFRERGVIFVESLDEVPSGSWIIFSAHGVSPAVWEKARARDLQVTLGHINIVTGFLRDLDLPDRVHEFLLESLAGNDGPNFTNIEENAYHVVTGRGVSAATLLDGFGITGGHAGASRHRTGAAVWTDRTPTLSNLRIYGNVALEAAVSFETAHPPLAEDTLVRSCAFIGNRARGLDLRAVPFGTAFQVIDSVFEGNSGDAVRSGNADRLSIRGCTFIGNAGNGLDARIRFHFELVDSVFARNADIAVDVNATYEQSTIRNCQIDDHPAGGIRFFGSGLSSLNVTGCAFRRNGDAELPSLLGALCFRGANLDVQDCIFSQNETGHFHGGAVQVRGMALPPQSASFSSCVFSSNSAPFGA
ncbi:MAG: right-handed parallel beta-helix repeat-containing protein, partial [Nitrospinae bacterium]|nr:right-handed parallel beta-helix repeat-containing protein [Nitrospinota bacterium]